jgi:hypothetical protein
MALASLVPATLFALAAPTPVPSPLPSYNWATSASPSLSTNPPPIDTVRTFVSNLLDTGNIEGMVCAIKFANFRNSGNLTLIAGHCGNNIDLVDRTSAGFEWRVLDGLLDPSDDVSTGIQDILGNGTSELVVHADLVEPVASGHCNAVWPVIYAWTSSNYANVSTQPQYAPWYQ